MGPLFVIVFYLGVVAYSVAATLFFVDLARPGAARALRWALRALAAGALLHALHLSGQIAGDIGALPLALSSSALITGGAYLAVRRRMQIDAVGLVVAPIALTFMVGAQFVHGGAGETTVPKTLLVAHIFANFLGVGLFLLAGAAGAFYLVQERRLKEKRATARNGRMPALDSLDSTEHRLLLAGFPLLTFGIVTGAVFAAKLDHMTGVAVARAGLAYATWVLLAGVLVLRATAGWRGRRAAYGTLAGVVCVMVVIVIYAVQSSVGSGSS